MINTVAESQLDALLVKMIGQKVPNYQMLRERMPGIDEVMMAPSEKVVVVMYTDHHMEDWNKYTTTAGVLRDLLENSTYDEHYPGWLLVFPWEEPCYGDCYQGIYNGGSDYYRAYVLEIDYEI